VPAKKLLAAALSAFVGSALLTSPAAATPAAAGCPTYNLSLSTQFNPDYRSMPWQYFWSEGEETFSFCVDISPDAAEVLVEVREFNSSTLQYEVVRTAPSGPGDKEFTYHVLHPSLYQLWVTGIGSSGTYQAGIKFSRYGQIPTASPA
jgi:hypothetical protein